jgi:transcriptional regulator with GAF, ATPase, and Fis domain
MEMKELSSVEKKRTELLQFVLLVTIMVLAVATFLSLRQEQGYLIPALTGICLCACLYVIGKERALKRLQSRLLDELFEKERQVGEEKSKSTSLKVRLKELTDLYRAISIVNSGTDHGRTFENVLRAALELVKGNCGSIMIVEETGDVLTIAASQGLSEAVVAQTRRKIGEGIAGWVAEHGEPVLLTGKVDEGERFQDIVEREEDVHISISVPLVLRNKVMGVLNLGATSSEPREAFSSYDMRVATIFAQHATIAIENARLMKEMVGSYRG